MPPSAGLSAGSPSAPNSSAKPCPSSPVEARPSSGPAARRPSRAARRARAPPSRRRRPRRAPRGRRAATGSAPEKSSASALPRARRRVRRRARAARARRAARPRRRTRTSRCRWPRRGRRPRRPARRSRLEPRAPPAGPRVDVDRGARRRRPCAGRARRGGIRRAPAIETVIRLIAWRRNTRRIIARVGGSRKSRPTMSERKPGVSSSAPPKMTSTPSATSRAGDARRPHRLVEAPPRDAPLRAHEQRAEDRVGDRGARSSTRRRSPDRPG